MTTSPEYDPSAYERSAAVYDVMNAARAKSYADEAATLLRLVRERVGGAESLLDVACGTGLHLVHLRDVLRVEGVEPHPRLRAIAQKRLAGVALHDGDMRTFDLGRRFDVVTCLFSAIGYMLTVDDLHAAIERMAARLSHSRREGLISHFDFYWTVGRGSTLDASPDLGAVVPPDGDHDHDAVEEWIEPHRLALWSDAQYCEAFEAAGLDVEHHPDGLIGRGLYLGRRPRS